MSDDRRADRPAPGSGTVTRSGDVPLSDRRDPQPDSGDPWSAPQQRQGGSNPPSPGQHAQFQDSDLRDHRPIFIAGEFRDLRARLFGSTSLSDYPVEVDDVPAPDDSATAESPSLDAQLTLDLGATAPQSDLAQPGSPPSNMSPTTKFETSHMPDPLTSMTAAPAELELDHTVVEPTNEPETTPSPPIGPIDWTTVSPQYAPRPERSDSRSRLTALIALALVITGVGVWLIFGPNAPRKAPSARPSTGNSNSLGLGPVGLRSNVDIARGNTVIVSQEVVFHEAVPSVTLTIPDRSKAPATDAFDPQVTKLEVTVNGAAVDVPDEPLGNGDSITVRLPEPSRSLTIDYWASGAVVVSKPSTQGRGLVLTNIVAVASTDGLTTTIDVNGPRILNLGCLEADGDMFPCGWSDVDDVWEYADVVGDNNVDVLAQVDLPN